MIALQQRQVALTGLLLSLALILSGCGPLPTATAPPAAVGMPEAPTPTAIPTTLTTSATLSPSPIAAPQPTLEPVTSRFLYVEGVTVSTLAGDGHWGYRDGPGPQARFGGNIGGMAIDRQGNLYIPEALAHRIRRITPDGMVSTLAGTGSPGYADGPIATAQFHTPVGLAVDAAGNVYVADGGNHRIRLIRPDGTVTTLAGIGEPGYRDGPAGEAQFNGPFDVTVSSTGMLYVADAGNDRIRAISPDGMVTTLAGSGRRGFKDGPPEQAEFNAPWKLTLAADGTLYVADGVAIFQRGNHAIRRVAPDGTVSTVAGTGLPGLADGSAAEAGFYWPEDLDVDALGNIYVADSHSNRIRVITAEGMVYTLAGSGRMGYADGPGPEAAFLGPVGVLADGSGHLFVSEYASLRIRVIDLPHSLVPFSPAPTPDPNAGQKVIKIGLAEEPHGVQLSASLQNAAQLAIDEANAAGGVTVGGERYTLALVTAQDWNLPGEADAEATARLLLDQGVVAVVGHIFSENSMAAAEVYAPASVVMVSAASSDPRVTQAGWPTVYRVTSNDAYLAPVAARMTYEDLGLRRAVLLGEADPHVRTAMDAWAQAFGSLGGEVLGRFEAEAEFSAEVLVELRNLAPEAVILFPARRLSPERAVQQVQETSPNAIIVGVESFTNLPVFLAFLGDRAEGIYDAVTGRPRAAMAGYAGFAERYREAGFAVMPDPGDFQAKWAPFGYDAAGVIIAAIHLAAEPALSADGTSGAEGTGEVTHESVAAAMDTFRDQPYQGVIGMIQFDEFGDLLDQPVYFQKVVNGQWVDVMPGER
jgi:ABC-type branched-subunit amino acid transport system substrate-binding protein/sugar lactone lactonase YvrE